MAIQILPAELANQIAAGEVVERPASIIKELIENSIDAGANQIDIDIEQGGCKLIRVRDNGAGIAKEELALALARHATSKISSLDDLEAIKSLGFRGEALASISSVSRLTLISKPESQADAWLVYAEGRDMLPVIKPTAHPKGTTIEVLDIFYNTPARRRFLKTEKTEFSHIDEVVRRIALAYPNVIFNLQHNGKLVKQYRVTQSPDQIEKRVATICGTNFMQKAIKLSWQHDDLFINGWIATNIGQEPLQYFYVNGRVVKDKLLNHALKQAFQETNKFLLTSTDHTLSYIIYLQLDPHQVDVNVHPAKHEVRFHEARLVHDFVYQAMVMALKQEKQRTLEPTAKIDSPSASAAQVDANVNYKSDTRSAAGQSIFDKTSLHNKSIIQNNQNVDYNHLAPPKKFTHIHENKIYGQLIQQTPATYRNSKKTVSPEQQAIIESLFPKHSEPLRVLKNETNVALATQLGRVLTIINNEFALLEKNHEQQQKISLLSLKKAQHLLFKVSLSANNTELEVEQLLIPLSILLTKQEQQIIKQFQPKLEKFGFQFHFENAKLQLISVPKLMRKANWQQLLPDLIYFLSTQLALINHEQLIIDWLIEHHFQNEEQCQTIWNTPKAIQILTELEQLDYQLYNLSEIIHPVDFSPTIMLFN